MAVDEGWNPQTERTPVSSSNAQQRGQAQSRRRSRPSPRERLLASATQLFTTEGIRVIGIDRILREADVAKASLYSLFGSKDALVVAYVQRLDETWRQEWRDRAEKAPTLRDKIFTFFDIEIEQQPGQNFRGSHFHNAAAEYPKPDTDTEQAILDAVVEHRRWCLDTLTTLLTSMNGYPSGEQAKQILILLDGAITGARLVGSIEPIQTARAMASEMLSTPPADYSI